MFSHRVMRGWSSVAATLTIAACFFVFTSQSLQAQSAADSVATRNRGNVNGKRQGPGERFTPERMQQFYEDILRKRLSFTDDQIVKWRAWNKRNEVDRMALDKEDREVRRVLRTELAQGVTPNEAKVVEAMDKWPVIARKRIALQEREAKELAVFMPPVQRARLFALQDEFRRGMQEMQWRRDGDGEGRGKMLRSDSTGGRPGFRGGGRGGRIPPRDSTRPPQ
jgi:hypothetical protein